MHVPYAAVIVVVLMSVIMPAVVIAMFSVVRHR
jgi:hypothetical protein